MIVNVVKMLISDFKNQKWSLSILIRCNFYQINLSFFVGFKCHFLTWLQTNQLLRAELVQLDLHKDLSRIKMQQVSENGSNSISMKCHQGKMLSICDMFSVP